MKRDSIAGLFNASYSLVLLLIALFCSFSAAAQYGITVRKTGQKVAVDRCRIRVTYEFRYATDTMGTLKTDHQFLEIGDSISRCYSAFGDRIDSLFFRARRAINPRKWMERDWAERYEDTYTGYPARGNMRTSIPLVNCEFFYDEAIPAPAWRIAGEEAMREVLGYACHPSL